MGGRLGWSGEAEGLRGPIAVVLAGDGTGNRILKAAELVRHGYTTRSWSAAPTGMYGYNEAELAISFAVRSGYPLSWFVAAPNKSRSTREEALAMVRSCAGGGCAGPAGDRPTTTPAAPGGSTARRARCGIPRGRRRHGYSTATIGGVRARARSVSCWNG